MATVLYGPRDLTQLPAQARPKPGTHAQTHVCQPASIGRHPCALSWFTAHSLLLTASHLRMQDGPDDKAGATRHDRASLGEPLGRSWEEGSPGERSGPHRRCGAAAQQRATMLQPRVA